MAVFRSVFGGRFCLKKFPKIVIKNQNSAKRIKESISHFAIPLSHPTLEHISSRSFDSTSVCMQQMLNTCLPYM